MANSLQGELVSAHGEGLSIAKHQQGNRLTLVVGMKTHSDCVLHWGLSRRLAGAWQRPPEAYWPAGTTPVDACAVHTPLASNEQGERQVAIQLELPCQW